VVKSIVTAPTIEPITTTELKEHLRIDSTSFADDLSVEQSIVPGDHVVASAYSLKGSGVTVAGFSSLVSLNSGTNGTSGTVDVKIQESDVDTNASYTDWSGGAFTQVTEANDNAVQEIQYTGTKQYIRVVSTVAVATCDFAVSVIKDAPTSAEDDYLDALITTVREYTEAICNRALLTQTWDVYFDRFPPSLDYISLPASPLQSVTYVKYTDSGETLNTLTTDDYGVDIIHQPGRIQLDYGKSWPSDTLWPTNPVLARIIAGYGDARSDVPAPIKQYIKLFCADMYSHRETVIEGKTVARLEQLENIIYNYKIWSF